MVKPGDHPEFFRFPAPEGRSRESTLRLDREGRFWHEGSLVEHAKLAQAMHTWVSRHPDDGRYILTNGYDWTYFTVDDAPFFVRSVKLTADAIVLVLSDGTEEPWDPGASRIGADAAIYTRVKAGSERGPFEAKFTRFAQAELGPALRETEDDPSADGQDGQDGQGAQGAQGARGAQDKPPKAPAVAIGGRVMRIGA